MNTRVSFFVQEHSSWHDWHNAYGPYTTQETAEGVANTAGTYNGKPRKLRVVKQTITVEEEVL